ncbi:MAG: helix-turn-helix domain-containing protein [Xanthomonadales bacterium]|nr:helix-turn-helix domain-containing protein [Xanthomonadales bacterium]
MTANLADQLAAELRRRGHQITWDGRVSLPVAAEILSKSQGTLRNWRTAGKGPITVKVGGSLSYRLTDLVAFMQS